MSTNSGNIKLAEIKMKYTYALSLHILNCFHFLTIHLKEKQTLFIIFSHVISSIFPDSYNLNFLKICFYVFFREREGVRGIER